MTEKLYIPPDTLKTYLIPIISNDVYDVYIQLNKYYYMAVYAYNLDYAYNKVKGILKQYPKYSIDNKELDFMKTNDEIVSYCTPDYKPLPLSTNALFPRYKIHDIIEEVIAEYENNKQSKSNTNNNSQNKTKKIQDQGDDQPMADLLYDTIYMGDYNRNISDLAAIALPESWTSESYQSDETCPILKRYLSRTFERLQDENKISMTNDYLAFNTGLFTLNYENIYLLAEKAINQPKDWLFKEFCTEYKFDSTDILTLPERADYFTDPSMLIFDSRLPVRVQYGHILDSNKDRLPKCISESKMKLQLFKGAVDISIKKVIANYKLAVPQYYEKKIQLLIPIYFEDDTKPDLALAVTKKDGYYQGHTCLTLDMAYSNARLIAKPESNWLNP